MSTIRAALAATATATLALGMLAGGAGPAGAATTAARHWAPAARAAIHPGTMMYTKGAQCTANFVYTDRAGDVLVGYAAHCAGTGSSTDTNGCTSHSLPLGTRVTFRENGNLADEGTRVGRGRLVYSSWLTMQRLGERRADPCAYNDLALVKVSRRARSRVNPSVPFWGGPTGVHRGGTASGDRVWTYGNSSLRGGLAPLSPHTGVSLGDDPADHGWSHPLYTASPGIPGDSGSGFLAAGGRAVGVLSTLGLAPLPASNNIGDLAHELRYARNHTTRFPGLHLVRGTTPFDPVL